LPSGFRDRNTNPQSVITGEIAVSPIAPTAISGFTLTVDLGLAFSTGGMDQINGKAYASDYGKHCVRLDHRS
jgi:hypothetical protein